MTNQFPLIMIAIKVLKTESAIINVTLLEFVHSFKNFGHFYFGQIWRLCYIWLLDAEF